MWRIEGISLLFTEMQIQHINSKSSCIVLLHKMMKNSVQKHNNYGALRAFSQQKNTIRRNEGIPASTEIDSAHQF